MTAERTADECLFHWRKVIGAAPEGWPRDFALSIQRARKRPAWQPSARQLTVMRRMVSDLFVPDLPLFEEVQGEFHVLEGG